MYNFKPDNDLDIIAHLGDDYEKHNDAVIPPVYLTSLHVMPKDAIDGPPRPYFYGRVNNPTVELFEKKVAALERADRALAFGSGMAAITGCLLANLASGDHIVAVDTAYGPTRMFITNHMAKYGIESTFIPGDDIGQFEEACRPNTKVFYLESPSSMVFLLQDLRAVAALAKEKGIVTMIDNSWATPLYQKPITLGIDISIHTVSKYIGGHSDIIAGIASANEEMIKKLESVRVSYGAILGPMEAWLAIRGLRSMPLRVREHGRSALSIAERLEKHRAIKKVRYPALKSDAQHELAKSQMTGFTSPFSIELDCDNEAARGFVKRLQCFNVGPSWGGFESMATLPYPPGVLVRLHIGLEDTETLYEDLKSSLDLI
jgi:cystathionine gamma-lyase